MGLSDMFEIDNDRINDTRANTLQRPFTRIPLLNDMAVCRVCLKEREKEGKKGIKQKFLDLKVWMDGPVICFYDEKEELGERIKCRRRKRRRERRSFPT